MTKCIITVLIISGEVFHPVIDKSSIHEQTGLHGGCSVNYRNEMLVFGIRSPGQTNTKDDYHHVSFHPNSFYSLNFVKMAKLKNCKLEYKDLGENFHWGQCRTRFQL